jgi:hypothetical protein
MSVLSILKTMIWLQSGRSQNTKLVSRVSLKLMPSPLREAISLLDKAKPIMEVIVTVMTQPISVRDLLMTQMPIVNSMNNGVIGLMTALWSKPSLKR